MQPPTPEVSASAKKRAQPSTPRGRVKKQQPTFVTSLSYPKPEPLVSAQEPQIANGTDLKRNMRQSKVDALSKLDKSNVNTKEIEREREKLGQLLNGNATNLFPSSFASGSGSNTPSASTEPGPARNPLQKKAARKVASAAEPSFKLENVRTPGDSPRVVPSRHRQRMFDLEDCPVFYPTAEEFQDPMKYIDWVGNEGQGKACGIAKIVPPPGWEMPFVLDTETFRFKTRLQRLNSLEASSRAKVNFLDQLYMFHKQQGDSKVTIPIIAHKTLDLWSLRKEVNKRGGPSAVKDSWKEIAGVLGYAEHLGIHIKMAYDRIIAPFDRFSARARSMTGSPLTPMTATPGSARMGGRMGAVQPTSGPSPLLSKMSKARLPLPMPEPELGALLPPPDMKPRISGFEGQGSDSELSEAEESSRGSPDNKKGKKAAKGKGTATKGEECEVCHSGEDGTRILLCDGCDQGYHIYCLEPPLPSVPKHEQWYCTACLFGTGNDYGFDEGEEHSLASFAARNEAFHAAWATSHPDSLAFRDPTEPWVQEQATEREFWRLVESQNETVEVEYGADVHSTTHGSGAPTLETHPLEDYSADPWNLNNLPILPDSLLRYIKSDVSGMTVPWIYIGMLFSTFCWHNEDHHTYSVNYMFWGDTKTWYGIPGSDAAKFEEAMKSEAPELFEQQPSLLYQLVTMMNPGRVKEAGVKVVACDQRPNEFVLTFPKAYHCGFNHGLNFNEAVNFALPDWLPDGAGCVEDYARYAKQPVFSHDELLMTITEHSDTIKTAMWLEASLRDLVTNELLLRRQCWVDGVVAKETLSEEDVPEEQYQCCVCKSFCYLTQITCPCTSQVACMHHASQICSCNTRVMRKRFSDKYLDDLSISIAARAAQPEHWQERLHRLLDESPRPPLKSLRALLTEGERIQYPLREIANLRAFVDRGNAWVDAAVQLMARKATARRKPKKGRRSEVESLVTLGDGEDEDKDAVDRTPAAVESLLRQAERLGFDAPEINQLRSLHLSIQDFTSQAAQALQQRESDCNFGHVESIFIIGSALNVDLPQLEPLGMIVKRLKWKHDLEEDVDDTRLDLAEVERFIAEAAEIGISEDSNLLEMLRVRRETGIAWKAGAEQCLATPGQTLEDYSSWLKVEAGTPTVEAVLRKLEASKKQALSWQTSARTILDSLRNGGNKGIVDIRKLFKGFTGPASHIIIPELESLRRELDLHSSWNEAAVRVLRCTPSRVNATVQDILTNIRDKLNPDDDVPFNPTRKALLSTDPSVQITRDTFTCYCRGPAVKTMATCESCDAAYHPRCVGVAPRTIQKEGFAYTCHMCEVKKPIKDKDVERPSLHELALLADKEQWAFTSPPQELAAIEEAASAAIRFARLLFPASDPLNIGTASRDKLLIEHFIRKLHMLPVVYDSRRGEERVVFEEWLFKRLEQAGVVPSNDKKRMRARRPKFKFSNDRPDRSTETDVVRCVCRTETAAFDDITMIKCSKCSLTYHRECVYAQDFKSDNKYKCAACHARTGTRYPLGLVRVTATEDLRNELVVDTKKTLAAFYNLVKVPLPRLPSHKTIVLEMLEFIPGLRPDDRPDFESTIAVVDHNTPWEPPGSAPKRQKLDALSNGVRPSNIGRYVPPSLQENVPNGTRPFPHEAVRPTPSGPPIVPTPQQSITGPPAEQSSSVSSILRTPFPSSDSVMERPRPLTFGQAPASAPLQYPYPGSMHRQTASVSETPSRPPSTRPYTPSGFLDQPPARSASSASTEPKASGLPTGVSRHSPAAATATATATTPALDPSTAPSSAHHEPLRRDSWAPRAEDKATTGYSASTSRYSPSWSQSAYASESPSSYPYGRDHSSHRDYAAKPTDSQPQRTSYYDEQPSRKRSLSPQPDQHRKPFFTSSYRPGTDLSARSTSPRPIPLTFGKPQISAAPSPAAAAALISPSVKSPTSFTHEPIPTAVPAPAAAPATPAATPIATPVASAAVATPKPSATAAPAPAPTPVTTTTRTLYVQSPTGTPRSEVKTPFTPSSADRMIPGLPSTRSPSAEKAAAVRLDRWVG